MEQGGEGRLDLGDARADADLRAGHVAHMVGGGEVVGMRMGVEGPDDFQAARLGIGQDAINRGRGEMRSMGLVIHDGVNDGSF